MTMISSDESLTYAKLAFADSLDMKQSINFTLVFCISNSSWNLTIAIGFNQANNNRIKNNTFLFQNLIYLNDKYRI